MQTRSVLTYDGLPAAAGGAHALRVRRARDAWSATDVFLGTCADVRSDAMFLRLWADTPAEVVERATTFAATHLGGPSRRDRVETRWTVRADQVEPVLAEIESLGREGATRRGAPALVLVRTADVRLLDPATGVPAPGIDAANFGGFEVDGYGRTLGRSGVRLSAGTTSSNLSLWLNLPDDDSAPSTAAHLQAHLPVRFSAKHWRRWQLTRDRSGYRSTRISSPLAASGERP